MAEIRAPSLKIVYCWRCGYFLKAAQLARAMDNEYPKQIRIDVTSCEEDERFEVWLNDEKVYDSSLQPLGNQEVIKRIKSLLAECLKSPA